jgi:hypothetical protein
MYMNNLVSTHNYLPLTQLSEPLFSTVFVPEPEIVIVHNIEDTISSGTYWQIQ